jgi:hypothetical protein
MTNPMAAMISVIPIKIIAVKTQEMIRPLTNDFKMSLKTSLKMSLKKGLKPPI